jgi:hypothetical protein
VTGGGAAAGATSIPVAALEIGIRAPAYLTFASGKKAVVTAHAADGATSLTVSALVQAIPGGEFLTVDGCPNYSTGGRGANYPPNCKMIALQYERYMNVLAPASAALRIWQYHSGWFGNAENRAASVRIKDMMSQLTRPRWSSR